MQCDIAASVGACLHTPIYCCVDSGLGCGPNRPALAVLPPQWLRPGVLPALFTVELQPLAGGECRGPVVLGRPESGGYGPEVGGGEGSKDVERF
jgi:hypothetical protein